MDLNGFIFQDIEIVFFEKILPVCKRMVVFVIAENIVYPVRSGKVFERGKVFFYVLRFDIAYITRMDY